MAGPEDVLALSEDLHAVAPGWPAQAAGPRLVPLPGAGRLLDAARRQAHASGGSPAVWPATPQPVGLLYGEQGVRALLAWLTRRLELRGAAGTAGTSPDELGHLRTLVERAAAEAIPLLRLYAYAAEAPGAIAIVVGARKEFVFWDTEPAVDSRESLPDLSALWTVGEAIEPPGGAPRPVEPVAAQRARACERRVLEGDARDELAARQREQLERLLAEDARLNPAPAAAEVIPTRAAILWRPHRLDLVDVERLRRWLHRAGARAPGGPLSEVASFVESASRERAALILEALCTDSPEAI